MELPWIFFLLFVATTAESYHEHLLNENLHRPTLKHNVIENKNVNIIVNVDPRDIAEELWKLIQSRLSKTSSRRFLDANKNLDELQSIVEPLVSTSRRGAKLSPTIQEIANQLDVLTRNALIKDLPRRDPIELEFLSRNIVSEMMVVLKKVFNDQNLDNDDDYLTLTVKIRKKQLQDMISEIQT